MRRTTHRYTIEWPDGDQVVREGPAGLREHGKIRKIGKLRETRDTET